MTGTSLYVTPFTTIGYQKEVPGMVLTTRYYIWACTHVMPLCHTYGAEGKQTATMQEWHQSHRVCPYNSFLMTVAAMLSLRRKSAGTAALPTLTCCLAAKLCWAIEQKSCTSDQANMNVCKSRMRKHFTAATRCRACCPPSPLLSK